MKVEGVRGRGVGGGYGAWGVARKRGGVAMRGVVKNGKESEGKGKAW